jgi:hypothetical protein
MPTLPFCATHRPDLLDHGGIWLLELNKFAAERTSKPNRNAG